MAAPRSLDRGPMESRDASNLGAMAVTRKLADSVLFAATLLLASLSAPGIHADAVDDLLTAEIQKRHWPGLAVAVVRDGQIIKTAAYGLANLELDAPATPKTVFQIQSITKTFTATAILLLVEDGKLSLDDPIARHLEGTPDSWKGITIRHLLNHTSGIKDFINDATASLRLEVTEQEVLQATASRPLDFPPGERWAYSNTNYHLLAMIIRQLSGQWYGDFLRERIFVPLGMTHTRPVSLSAIIPNRASGYLWTGQGYRQGEFIAESILAYGGGGILSTAPDMALWAQALLTGQLLKPETINQAWTPASLNDGKPAGYGLGWGIGRFQGHREVNHAGGHATGFSSFLGLYPDDQLGVVVLLNRAGANPGRIARRVAGLYIPELTPQPEKPIEDDQPDTTGFLSACLTNAATAWLEESRFTAEMWQVLEDQKTEIQTQLRTLGTLQSLELLSSSKSGEFQTSRYRAAFANGTLIISVSLDPHRRVAGLSHSEED
jgi:D-alanyl-D-alanine carboxypeptidase